MSESEKPNGCVGCLSAGCAVYILRCITSGIYYYFCNNAQEEVKACTFKETAHAQLVTDYGIPSGWDNFLKCAQNGGIELNKKLSQAIAQHQSIISNVTAEEYAVTDDACRVIITMRIAGKDSSGKRVQVKAQMVFLALSKSLLNRHFSHVMGMEGIVLSDGEYEKPLEMRRKGETTSQLDGGFLFLGGLFMKDDAFLNEFITKFADEAKRRKV